MSHARAALLIMLFLPGCDVLPPIDFQRMIYQDRFTVWQHCAYFPDGRELQAPPEHTIPRDAPSGPEGLITGLERGAYLEELPLPLTRALLLSGRARFETYCAVCHGIRGDGASVVAEAMTLRRPPALAGPDAHRHAPGHVYQVIGEGYGLMRSYAEDLTTPEERWSVVAYLLALQTSQGVPLDALPPEARQEAERKLR
jgi:mono/diheme cytochrome c family protein